MITASTEDGNQLDVDLDVSLELAQYAMTFMWYQKVAIKIFLKILKEKHNIMVT